MAGASGGRGCGPGVGCAALRRRGERALPEGGQRERLAGVFLASACRVWEGGLGWVLGAAWLIELAGGGGAWGAVEAGVRRAAYGVWQPADWEQGTVPAMLQSREGYLWLGTYHGLVRFDGVRYQVFDASNAPGLTNGVITSLYEDGQGALWIGHETGDLTRLSAGVFQAVKLGASAPWAPSRRSAAMPRATCGC